MQATRRPAAKRGEAPMSPIAIVLIEKERARAERIRTHLEQLGHTVSGIAGSVTAAITLIKKSPPDLVITALDLRGKADGFSAAERIPAQWNIPAVFLVPSADSPHLDRIGKIAPGAWIAAEDSPRLIDAVLSAVLARYRMHRAIQQCQAEALMLQRQYQTFFENELFGVWRVDFPEPLPLFRSSRRTAEAILACGYIAECNHRIVQMYGLNSQKDFIGTPVRDVVANRDAFLSRLTEVAQNDFRALSVETQELDSGGNVHWFNNCYFGNVSDRKLYWLWGFQLDISEQKQAEAFLHRQVLEQEIILNVSQSVAGSLELERVLQTISDGTARLLDVETAAIYLTDGDDLFLGATTPPLDPGMPDDLRRARLGEHPTIDRVVTEKKPVTVYDAGKIDLSPAEQRVVSLRSLRSLLFLPILHENDAIGVLILGTVNRPRTYSDHEIDLCRTITNELALGIQNARLHEGLITYTQQLENEINERKRAETQVQKDLKEKELLLKEIHHRVKNNLQVISSLLGLQAANTDNEQALQILEDSRNRIHSMALVHDGLYQSKEFTNVTFNVYIRNLVSRLMRTYVIDPGRVDYTLDVDDVALGIDKAIPCGLVMNELISNALKYAFPPSLKRRGEINIAVRAPDTGKIEMKVNDNGVGLPEGFDLHAGKSLGLRLVTMLVEDQLGGSVTLSNREGTTFIIRFNRE